MVRPVAGLPSIKNGPVWVACNMNWLATKPPPASPRLITSSRRSGKALNNGLKKSGRAFPFRGWSRSHTSLRERIKVERSLVLNVIAKAPLAAHKYASLEEHGVSTSKPVLG